MTQPSYISTHPKPLLKALLCTVKSLSAGGKASIGALVNLFLSSWNASSHCFVHSYLVAFLVRFISGVAIFEKF